MRGGARRKSSTVPEKVAWLRHHPELWDKTTTEIVKAMKKAGLVAQSTYYLDVRVKQLLELVVR